MGEVATERGRRNLIAPLAIRQETSQRVHPSLNQAETGGHARNSTTLVQ